MIGGRRVDEVDSPWSRAPTSGVLRLLRGTTVGATAMGLALAGHVAGGGTLAASATSVAVFCLAVAGGVALSGRRWTLAELLTVLLGVQVVFHIAYGNHAMGSVAVLHGHAAHGVSASMLLGHLLAALGAALVLRRGESWCWRLVALLGRPVLAVRAFDDLAVPDVGLGPARTVESRLPVLRSLLLADAQPRRGPPALLAR
jgi:hypothetical protein